ncbi:MAG: ATP-binding protein, partial [Cyanobacteria bacterium P01_A01_bin.135]
LHGRASPDGVTLHLSDNGVGMDLSQPTSGFGLQGIRERSQLIGADVVIHSTPGQGTTIQITVPQ